MPRTVGIGHQDFGKIRENNYFYIDKTLFIKEWWERGDNVTLITRPRRFGKTLIISMTEQFFSVNYQNRTDLFEGLSIWKEEKYHGLQGKYPVISLSFADVKETSFIQARKKICRIIKSLYNKSGFLLESGLLNKAEQADFNKISTDMEDNEASYSLKVLSDYLCRYFGRKVIILLDEYDTPMQEAYLNGYWDELSGFTRNLFNATFKNNPYMDRAIMTGITRISKESVFSDLNNLKVVTTTSNEYTDFFGFTEEEVFAALDEFGLSGRKQEVKEWYDGFIFGGRSGIYNPWSVINYLDSKKIETYWANTSSNSIAGKLIRESNKNIKQDFEILLNGGSIITGVDEQVVYNQLNAKKGAIWGFLLAGGYLKVLSSGFREQTGSFSYELALTNKEVHTMFQNIICDWFSGVNDNYNDFIKALMLGDIKAMNVYMNRVAMETFSYFDTGKKPSCDEPERFYHGFVLGLVAGLAGRYIITSNRESGFGRYDVMLEPSSKEDSYIIMEFKVQDMEDEKSLKDTIKAALDQIEKKKYASSIIAKGIPEPDIRKYGFAFCGKKVLIGDSTTL